MLADSVSVSEGHNARAGQDPALTGTRVQGVCSDELSALADAIVHSSATAEFRALSDTVSDVPLLNANLVGRGSSDEVAALAAPVVQSVRVVKAPTLAASVVQRVTTNSY